MFYEHKETNAAFIKHARSLAIYFACNFFHSRHFSTCTLWCVLVAECSTLKHIFILCALNRFLLIDVRQREKVLAKKIAARDARMAEHNVPGGDLSEEKEMEMEMEEGESGEEQTATVAEVETREEEPVQAFTPGKLAASAPVAGEALARASQAVVVQPTSDVSGSLLSPGRPSCFFS